MTDTTPDDLTWQQVHELREEAENAKSHVAHIARRVVQDDSFDDQTMRRILTDCVAEWQAKRDVWHAASEQKQASFKQKTEQKTEQNSTHAA